MHASVFEAFVRQDVSDDVSARCLDVSATQPKSRQFTVTGFRTRGGRFPQLGEVRILRHWAGLPHASSDYAPLLGEHPEVKDFWFSAGWSYGFAGAPAAGYVLAEAIARGRIDHRMKPFALDRFEKTRPIIEGGIVMA